MKLSTTAVVMLAGGLAAAGAMYYGQSGRTSSPIAQTNPHMLPSPAASATARKNLHDLANTASSGHSPRPNPWDANSMASALKKSNGYSAFIREALRDPGQGGAFYAQTLLKRCSQVRFSMASVDTKNLSASSKAAMDEFNSRCDMAPEQYQDLSRSVQYAGERDPMVKIANDMTSPDPKVKRLALAQALQSRDPFLLFETNGLSFYRTEPTAFGKGTENVLTYFNGQWLNASDAIPLGFAEKLAACDFASPCQKDDTWLNELCIVHGECAESRQDYLNRFVYPNQPEWRDKIERYHDTIKSAILNGSVDTFIPVNAN